MNNDERRNAGHGPAGLAAPEGFSRGRVLSMAFALAISLGMGWRENRPPPNQPASAAWRPDAPALATAVSDGAPATATAEGAVVPLPAATLPATQNHQASTRAALPDDDALPQSAEAVAVAHIPAARPHGAAKRHPRHGTAVRAGARGQFRVHNGPQVNPWASDYNPLAHTRLTRTRAEVRNEYLASREQVAAFSGEDSGSAYLARQRALHGTAPANVAAATHGRGKAKASRQSGTTASAARGAQAATG
jgi:hypothetical protein